MANWTLEGCRGVAIAPYRDAVAALRLQVFHEWPYLYEGTLADEITYLRPYIECPDSLVVLARHQDTIIGASTALPLRAAHAEFRAPFERSGDDIDAIYYFGESVVLPAWRGHGIGRAFFAAREDRARELGFETCVFCAVDRDPDDPRRPRGHTGNDTFWTHRGYQRDAGRTCRFPWRDRGDDQQSLKTLTFWRRNLKASAGAP